MTIWRFSFSLPNFGQMIVRMIPKIKVTISSEALDRAVASDVVVKL